MTMRRHEDVGDGRRPRILLLHGFLERGVAWQGVVRALAPDADPIAPDLLGHGRAARPGGEYTLERVAAALGPLVDRARPDYVVGHSMGAIVALALARSYPRQFAAVGLVGLPVFASRAEGEAVFARRGPLRRAFLADDRRAHVACRLLHATRSLWVPSAPLYLPGIPRHVLGAAFDHNRESHEGALQHIVFSGHVPALAAATEPPVALLHGAEDGAAPLAPVRSLAARHGWDLHVAPGANHEMHIRQPARVAAWVRDFTREWPAPGGGGPRGLR